MQIELDDEDNVQSGLVALVITVVELIVDTMELEAVRRMESGELSDEEIERMGCQLQALEEELERIKELHNVEDDTEEIYDQLDGIVEDTVKRIGSDQIVDDGDIL